MLRPSAVVSLAIVLTLPALACGDDDTPLPIVPDGFVVDVVAREPLVRNPCVMAFDQRGRLFVGQGQQWRAPTPDTPGDRVDLLIDDDGDGTADRVHTFADGFNCIQGLAWRDGELWVANAPDLTVVRDTDNDDVADEYLRVYTGLGNLEHSLHGLNFAPDGKLYMSKGNSRGENRLEQLAPWAFRELWGLPAPEGAVDYPPQELSSRNEYRRRYHTPNDDWGQSGGILRCDPVDAAGRYGRNLEIISRGFRNPWDMAFDDAFNWLGTDNDQTQGDKIFAPFYGAHFGWGHPWSYSWTGENHLPTVPASAPLFEGSGAGVAYYHAHQFPPPFRNLFFINDWMRREIYAFRPRWNGGLLNCTDGFPATFARAEGGRTLPGSSGTVFDPTDIETGPDGALYVLSWGHAYGATIEGNQQVDQGRVYRIRYAANPLADWQQPHRQQPLSSWSIAELIADLGGSVPAWRTNAQAELIRRITAEIGAAASSHALRVEDALADSRTAAHLLDQLSEPDLPRGEQTWILWALGQCATNSYSLDTRFLQWALDDQADENTRLQSLRILAHRRSGPPDEVRTAEGRQPADDSARPPSAGQRSVIRQLLQDDNPRLRHAMILVLQQTTALPWVPELLERAHTETDRVVFYSIWQALRQTVPAAERRRWLQDKRAGVRLAALLGLFEDDALAAAAVKPLRQDPDPRVAKLVEMWLQKTGGAEPLVRLSPSPGEFTQPVSVTLTTSVPGAVLKYTTDGSTPVNTSQRYSGPITVDRNTTLKVIIVEDNTQAGPVVSGQYDIRHVEPYRHRAFVTDIHAGAAGEYRMDWTGLSVGRRQYTDRTYSVTRLPAELQGLPYLQTCNSHDRISSDDWLRFTSSEDVSVLIGVDVRVNAPLGWMKIGQPDGFVDTGLDVATTDATFRIYQKDYAAGEIILGGNTNDAASDSRRGMYVVIFDRPLLQPPQTTPVTAAQVLAALPTALAQRGRELFLHPRGAGCVKCHQMEGLGRKFAPDLSDIGSRAKANILIDSILHPSAVITEGFAQQQIITVQGRAYSGAVLEESGRSVTLVSADAVPVTIPRADIEERVGSRLSPMPAGFAKMLSAQQVADIVAWLQTQKSVGDRSGFSFRDHPDRLDIFFGSQQIATYLKDHPELTRRALVNVTTPGGIRVTRNFPPRAPEDLDPGYRHEDGIIHPRMHPGIWVSYGNLNGEDYWRLQSKVVFDGFVTPPSGTRDSGQFAVRNLYHNKAGDQVVCAEVSRYQFTRTPQGLLLRLSVEYTSEQEFYFGDQEESGLAVRVASPLRVQGGNGTIVNDRGERNGGEIWGKPARWFDYSGEVDGRHAGLLVMPDPQNARSSWLHARNYGVVVTNPFPKQPRERREPYVTTPVRQGETFRLAWAILIHDTPATETFDLQQAAAQVLSSFAARP